MVSFNSGMIPLERVQWRTSWNPGGGWKEWNQLVNARPDIRNRTALQPNERTWTRPRHYSQPRPSRISGSAVLEPPRTASPPPSPRPGVARQTRVSNSPTPSHRPPGGRIRASSVQRPPTATGPSLLLSCCSFRPLSPLRHLHLVDWRSRIGAPWPETMRRRFA